MLNGFELIATRGHLGYSYKKSGTLTAGQLARMAQIIEKLELPSIGYSELYLARGGEAEFGWGGHITYMQDGKSYNVKFTSQQSRTQQLDATLTARFLTFMGDMDSFFQEEISF